MRQGVALFNRGDADAALDLLDDELEWDTTALLPDGTVYRGRAEIKAYWTDVWDRWDELQVVPDEWLESVDCVVMLGRLQGRGAGSGVPIESLWHQVWRFENDRLVRCENYSDRDEALQAAGAGG